MTPHPRGMDLTESIRLGAILYATGMLLLAGLDAFIKLVGDNVTVGQAWLFRSVFGLIPVLGYILIIERQKLRAALQTKRIDLQILRGLFGAGAFVTVVFALRESELSAVAAFGLVAPLLMVLLGGLVLGERISMVVVALCAAACAAAFLMVPTSSDIGMFGATFAFLSAASHACASVVGRVAARYDPPATMALYTNLVALACALVAVVVTGWMPMSLWDVIFCICIGLCGGGSYLSLSFAIKYIEVSKAAVLEYTVYAWAVLLGLLVFRETPSWVQLVSVAVIVGCAVFAGRMRAAR